MRRSLTISILTIIVILAVIPAQASWVSDLFWGRHRQYVDPGITYAIDEYLPQEWASNIQLMFRYHQTEDKVFAGTKLEIGVMVTNKDIKDAIFAIGVTDDDMINGDLSGVLNFKLKERKGQIGGIRILGTFRGKYGKVSLDTYRMGPGTKFLYTFVLKDGKYQAFSERPLPLYIAPPLGEMIEALKDASDETLKSWGLEAIQTTAEQAIGRIDLRPAIFDVVFADGGKMSDVRIAGTPKVGRVLGVFSMTALEGIVRVDSVNGNIITTSTRSNFLSALNASDLTVAWVVRVRKYADSSPKRQLTTRQQENLATYPQEIRGMMWEMATTSAGTITKADGSVILTDSVVHLQEPFHKNTSGMYQLAYQVWTSQHEHWVPAPQQQEWMPESYLKHVRVIKLSSNGVVHGVIDEAKITATDRPGLFPGIAHIIGQAIRKPDRTSVNNNSTNSATAPTTVDVDSTNNNSNANTNVNPNNNTINVGDGTATGTATGTGDSTATSDP